MTKISVIVVNIVLHIGEHNKAECVHYRIFSCMEQSETEECDSSEDYLVQINV